MADLREWSLKFPDLRDELETEIATRKVGRQKPLRYQKAIDNYTEAVKFLENIISKTDPNVLCQRLNELEDNCHESELIHAGLRKYDERIKLRRKRTQ